MTKKLKLSRTIHDLVEDYPELRDVMQEIGFRDIAKPMALNTVGRVMTIPKGCAIKEFKLDEVVAKLEASGFEVIQEDEQKTAVKESQTTSLTASADLLAKQSQPNSDERSALLKSYVRRLTEGEDLESVREDFAAKFSDVDASEIMTAEQELIAEGTPLPEVTRLCDVHSALFHGATREEIDGAAMKSMMSNAATAVEAAFAKDKDEVAINRVSRSSDEAKSNHAQATAHITTATTLSAIPGHPLNLLTSENSAIAALLDKISDELDKQDLVGAQADIQKLRHISIHYSKKGDLLYPMLANRYNITGPANVMWTVDDEIRDELRQLAGSTPNVDWITRTRAVLQRAKEMIYKEAHILFPICAANFSEKEWQNIAFDLGDYAPCLVEKAPAWELARPAAPQAELTTEKVVLPSGSMTAAQLRALLNTIPGEISFVDTDDNNSYFNEGAKDFKRPLTALGRPVYSCHPPKVEGMVRWLFNEFRAGKQNSFEVWHKRDGRDLLVRYIAVRDEQGSYLGTLEFVEDLTAAHEHFVPTPKKTDVVMDELEKRQDQEW